MTQEETFVLGDIEVKKTGRTASKPLPGNKTFVVVEITPASDFDGTWKKWVRPDTLFHIDKEPKA